MEILKKTALFWDMTSINPQKDYSFVITRILNFGDLEDFKWAVKFYGREKVRQVLLESRQLEKKTLNFWRQYFNIDKLQCISNPLANKPSAYWQR